MDAEQTGLIERIRRAFAGVELGSGISLNMTEYLDSYGGEEAFLTLAKNDERHNWQAIPNQTLEQFTCTFSFTDIAGFRFYLPAYMTWMVTHHDESDSVIGDFTIYAIDTEHYIFEDRPMTQAFTPQQLACMIDFLAFCVRHDGTCDGRVAGKNLKKLRAAVTRQDRHT